MVDEKHKLREEIRNVVVASIAAASFILSLYTLVDNRQARRDVQHPYIGIDDAYADPDQTLQIVGGSMGKGTSTTPGNIYAVLRVYGNSPAIITSYKIDCISGEWRDSEDSHPNLTLLPGSTRTFTCDRFSSPGQPHLDNPETILAWKLTKPIQITLTFEYEDVFHRRESQTFCFSNRPDWDRKHLRSCETQAPVTK